MPGQPRTGRGRASRERIVERAAELFAERGVTATSLDEVLAAAGAGKSQLYHYFRGRNELVEAAVGLRCAQVLAELTQALGAVASLAELEQALAGFADGYEQMGLPGCPIGSLAAEVAERNDGARLQAVAAFDAWERLFADALERMRGRGELRADASPAALATALLASIEGGMVLSQTRKDPASLRIAVEAGLAQVRTYPRPVKLTDGPLTGHVQASDRVTIKSISRADVAWHILALAEDPAPQIQRPPVVTTGAGGKSRLGPDASPSRQRAPATR